MPVTSLAERFPEPIAAAPKGSAGPHNGIDEPDDPDEATVADTVGSDEEPTTIRPTPLPQNLARWEAATVRVPGPARGPRSQGRVGKYQLHTRLARGAFGVVYTAHDPNLERNVAIKVLRPTHLTNHDVVQRFLQEARATARIGHPGIVTIHDCGTVETRRGSTAFIAMELLSGESLSSRLARAGRLAPPVACEIVRQVASALEAAHQVDVLHRDLKPDNIFLVPDPAMPSGERVKVLDFGLAKLGAGGQTQLQTVFGTPRYISPEQSRSATQIDHRSDIYALGCILFELVVGRLPFDGDVRQLLDRHQRATPPRAASIAPEVPAALDNLIAAMLAKDPMQRPQTMGAVQRALRFAVDGPAPTEAARRATDPTPPFPAPVASQPPRVVRPPSSPPCHPAPPLRPPTSPPALASPRPRLALPSLEVSISATPSSTPQRRPAAAPRTSDDAGAVSGELLVPASGSGPVPAVDRRPAPVARTRHRTAFFWLCAVMIAALALLAVALSF